MIEKLNSHYFLTLKPQPPSSRPSSSCVVCICLHRRLVFISTQPTKPRRPYTALTLDTLACVHRCCSAGDWCLGETISSEIIEFWPQSCQKVASFPCLADCQGGDDVRARVAVMAAPPWLLLFLLLCWPNLSQPAHPTNQPHQVKVGQPFAYMLTLWFFWVIWQSHKCTVQVSCYVNCVSAQVLIIDENNKTVQSILADRCRRCRGWVKVIERNILKGATSCEACRAWLSSRRRISRGFQVASWTQFRKHSSVPYLCRI